MTKHSTIIIKKRSKNLAIRTQAEISSDSTVVIVHPKDFPQMTLKQRSDAFDTNKHGGEIMASSRPGAEMF